MSALFSELKIKDITFRNRIGVSPMCQYSSNHGMANDWHLVQLGSRAVGGAGFIMSEATAVTPDGRITPKCAGLWSDEQIEPLTRINSFVKDHGAVIGVQIGHSGRKGSAAVPWDGGAHLSVDEGGWEMIAPTDQAFDQDGTRLMRAPHQMSLDEIKHIQNAFAESAKRALTAGYQLLEIHGAHGYLLHSFFTPLVNTRDDAYGGDIKGRAKMMLETVDAVRAVWPENLPLAVRLSAADWIEGGLTVEDNIQMAKWLKDRGVDIVDCSGGGATPEARASMGERTANQPALAGKIREQANIMTMAVGAITDAKQAEALIASGQADIALMARQSLLDPYWPIHAATELGVSNKVLMPVQNGFFVGK
ncbi:NADH:flavin oxidoreductase/NADH oxidase [Cocleimonas flava]|uniref:2,4-dienoyl-CoA reductase-like NADH-dependent reductase (Old Yellow Enzyme family) n=1 Tax=Cocleimonas flava TaxID=634765 RepID=A0A4R1F3N4_9GAMM|nr:NADH:flavin oxidoreductase/NADH oxidase [Cocleimonas flava]TCJ85031.1 2,4-dienoyl-CoA reductase-like NADH-dependent reductase (Old Yellow Enzyme family) [Cocleimonas flava]